MPGRYRVEAQLFLQETLGGARFTLNGTAVLSECKIGVCIYDTGGLRTSGRIGTLGTDITHSSAGAGDHQVTYTGTINVTTAGSLGVYWAQNTSNAANLTMESGSFLRLIPVLV